MSVINKMWDVFGVIFITEEPWYLAKHKVYINHNHYESCRKKHDVT